MLKQELRSLANSVWLNGVQMYPGLHVFTWAKAPWGWSLISIEPKE